MLDLAAVNLLFEERKDIKGRGELAKVLDKSGGWGSDALYSILTNRHLSPYWSLIRETLPTLPCISEKSFSGKDLSGLNLSDMRFADCRFLNTLLVGCSLDNSSFSRCSFTNASLKGTTWSGSRVYDCDFRRALVLEGDFCGLIYRKSKMPSNLPKHRSHARKALLKSESKVESTEGQVRYISPDAHLYDSNGVYSWTPQKAAKAWKEAYRSVGNALNYSVDNRQDISSEVVILCGLPGSGKSTYYRENLRTIVPGLIRVVFDATLVDTISRSPLVNICSGAKVRVKCVFIDTPVIECLKRNSSRNPDRRVPPEVISRMRLRLVPPSKEEGFDEVVVIS